MSLSSFCRANCSTPGASARQKAQVGAQNHTSTGDPAVTTSAIVTNRSSARLCTRVFGSASAADGGAAGTRATDPAAGVAARSMDEPGAVADSDCEPQAPSNNTVVARAVASRVVRRIRSTNLGAIGCPVRSARSRSARSSRQRDPAASGPGRRRISAASTAVPCVPDERPEPVAACSTGPTRWRSPLGWRQA